MTAFLRRWFPIDAGPRSPLRQVADHVCGAVWLVVMLPAVWRWKRGY